MGSPERFRRVLLERRGALLASVIRVDDHFQEIHAEAEIEGIERGQERAVERLLERLDARERAEIAEIDAALRRLLAGEYGRCEVCGEAIPEARLAVHPTARRCLPCAEVRERQAGQEEMG